MVCRSDIPSITAVFHQTPTILTKDCHRVQRRRSWQKVKKHRSIRENGNLIIIDFHIKYS